VNSLVIPVLTFGLRAVGALGDRQARLSKVVRLSGIDEAALRSQRRGIRDAFEGVNTIFDVVEPLFGFGC
jgi:hypothetical protein